MNNSIASIVRNNRYILMLLGVSLVLVAFCAAGWTVDAQQDARAAMKARRILADNEAPKDKVEPAADGIVPKAESANARRYAVASPEVDATCTAFRSVIYAYDFFDDHLYSFTAAAPGTYLTNVQLTGLAADEFLIGMDYRPATGQLVATVGDDLGTKIRVVSINTTTGALTPIGGINPQTADIFFAADVNPVSDSIRVNGDADSNRRFNPDTGALTATDTNLVYASGDPGFGISPSVVHAAYNNNQVGAASTTLFGLDSNRNTLVTIGGVNGTPSPNGGQLFTVGPTGTDFTSFGGFDIQPFTNNAYASLRISGTATLYSINLTTGAATMIGTIGSNGPNIDGLAVTPCAAPTYVEVSGRVVDQDDRGVKGAVVTITDSNNNIRRATTSTFGYYTLSGIEAGINYTISVTSRRYQFLPRTMQINNSLTNIDFVAE